MGYKNGIRYVVDKETVIKLVRFNYRSVRSYCKSNGISTQRFYQIINKKHYKLDNASLQKLANSIYLKPEEIVHEIEHKL